MRGAFVGGDGFHVSRGRRPVSLLAARAWPGDCVSLWMGSAYLDPDGTIAALAAGFGLYLSRITGLSPSKQKLAGAVAVLLLTAVNLLGLPVAKRFQNVSTAAKIGGLILFGALLFWRGHAVMLANSWNVATN